MKKVFYVWQDSYPVTELSSGMVNPMCLFVQGCVCDVQVAMYGKLQSCVCVCVFYFIQVYSISFRSILLVLYY